MLLLASKRAAARFHGVTGCAQAAAGAIALGATGAAATTTFSTPAAAVVLRVASMRTGDGRIPSASGASPIAFPAHAPTRLLSTRSPRTAAATPVAPPSSDPADLPFSLPSAASLPAGSFVLGYLAQAGQLSPMLDEIESQENARSLGVHAQVLGIHGNLVLVRFDRIGGGAASSAATDAASAAVDPIPSSMLHPLHAATVWYSPSIASFRSISHATQILREALRNSGVGSKGVKFSTYVFDELPLARRSNLILESLPRSKVFSDPETRHTFPLQLGALLTQQQLQGATKLKRPVQMQMDEHGVMQPVSSSSSTQPATSSLPSTSAPLPSLAAFTLLSSSVLLYSPRTSSPLPNGALSFQWDRTGPPSRAYLKLWEALSRVQIRMMQDLGVEAGAARWERIKPQKHSLVLDLGAAPGGWTWALAQMGATVVSVDRAELSLGVARLPNVHHHLGSGFSVGPDAQMLQPFLEKREKQRRKAASKARAEQERAASQQQVTAAEEHEGKEEEEEDEYAEQAAQLAAVEFDQDFPAAAEPTPCPTSALSTSSRRVDWLFSDIVCYPDRSLALIERWLKADAVECGIIVTIKMQSDPAAIEEPTPPGFIGSGAPREGAGSKGAVQRHHLAAWPEVLARLRAIPHSTLTHLQENKNELTFAWIRPSKEDEEKLAVASSGLDAPKQAE